LLLEGRIIGAIGGTGDPDTVARQAGIAALR
jgi:sugar diacid utilization regulator